MTQHLAMPDPRIRPIEPADVSAVTDLVYELAEYERLRSECHLTADQLTSALFGPAPALYGLVAISENEIVGYALYFLNFSTWEGVHGIYLEDLYVRPGQRGSGLGRGLLLGLADIAERVGLERTLHRLLRIDRRRANGRLVGVQTDRAGAAGRRPRRITLLREAHHSPEKGSGNWLIQALAGLLISR
jgi:GNAT superfamily N-acetyltransferase